MNFTHVYHIDDDPDDTEFFFSAAMEASEKVNIEIFFDSSKALKNLAALSVLPDAVFLDLNMPVLDGFDFLRELKKNAHLKSLPVIILSTASHPDAVSKCKMLGAAGFITKPSNFYSLVDILKAYL